ncbi:MAG: DNA/RNA nuclease SfsA [Deltaproteobacteria bacterium]|nr:DNA/RNA nuclease SfsA [Deltaproteobacteria bacterium]
MRFTSPLIPARFLERHKRFLALVELADGRQVWVHVPNSGALTGCAPVGGDILITLDRRPGRKTDYTWRFTRLPGGWTCIDTLAPNRLVAEALAAGGLPGLPRPLRVRAEVSVPQGSRLDFVQDTEAGLLFLEVKSITWVEDGVALFPDGVTSRGRRHLEHLAALVGQGHQAWNVFVVQRQDARLMRPAVQVDPAYARELAAAHARGVGILVLQEKIDPPEITLASTLPFDLT